MGNKLSLGSCFVRSLKTIVEFFLRLHLWKGKGGFFIYSFYTLEEFLFYSGNLQFGTIANANSIGSE